MQSKKTISYDEANKYIRNKPGFVEALGRDGYIMPSIHSALCTLDFLNAVRKKLVYCPRRDEIPVVKKCYSRPPKAMLLEVFIEGCGAKFERGEMDDGLKKRLENLITMLKSKDADATFYLALINVVAPDWEGFTKGFVYRHSRDLPIEPEIDNSDQL